MLFAQLACLNTLTGPLGRRSCHIGAAFDILLYNSTDTVTH